MRDSAVTQGLLASTRMPLFGGGRGDYAVVQGAVGKGLPGKHCGTCLIRLTGLTLSDGSK